tara:strand:- start:13 stop:645 length:633 start_codon:yes stop_codon:yes gene_type:complete
MKSNSVLFTKEKSITKYNGSNNSIDWKVDFDKHITGISRVDDYVFVTKMNIWGTRSNSTSLIDFKSGKKLWNLKEIFHSIHIIKDVLIFKNSTNKFTAIDINSGIEKFSLKSPFRWSTTKTFLLNGKFYIFSSKTIYLLNIDNGKLTESKLPERLNAKELISGFILDEFQININNIPSSDSGHMIMGHTAGADIGVGDAGGGDAGGGGGE